MKPKQKLSINSVGNRSISRADFTALLVRLIRAGEIQRSQLDMAGTNSVSSQSQKSKKAA